MPRQPNWYRTRLDPAVLRSLTRRSDLCGLAQCLGVLALWVTTGGVSLVFYLNALWVPMMLGCYLHSMVFCFMGLEAAVHELSHGTAFKSRRLNDFFYGLFSFLSWADPVYFRHSHGRHHQHTVIEGEDKEVILTPAPISWKDYLSWWLFDYKKAKAVWLPVFARFFGRDLPDTFFWDPLFEKDDPRRRASFWWCRFLVIGHLALALVFALNGLGVLVYLVSLGYWFGGFFSRSCGMMQHIGLTPNVRDWRVNSRTVLMGRPLRFLYWNMNYHLEHHMYAAVPFYNLPKLHRAIAHDTPAPVKGFFRGFAHLVDLQNRQRRDPSYTYKPEFPATATPPRYDLL